MRDVPAATEVYTQPIELPHMDNLSPLAQVLRGKLLYNHVSTATREVAKARFAALKEGQNFHDLGSDLKTTYDLENASSKSSKPGMSDGAISNV